MATGDPQAEMGQDKCLCFLYQEDGSQIVAQQDRP